MAQTIHRIVGLTLTMMQATTVITNKVRKIVSESVFDDDRWPLFDKERAASYSIAVPPLTVIEFIATGSDDLGELATAAGAEAIALITSIPGIEYRTWLFVAHGPWQLANRIVRYNKLWKEHRDLIQSSGVIKVGDEVEIESSGLIRFAGFLEVTGEAFLKAINLVRTNSACAIICSKQPEIDSEASVRSIFLSAFPEADGTRQVSVDWMTLAIYLCPQGDILIRVSGLFDDREAAADVIAAKGIIASL